MGSTRPEDAGPQVLLERMRWVIFPLVFVVAVAVAAVSGRPAVGHDGQRLRVATFNIHKGADRQERYDLGRTIQAIAGLDADLVGAQEVLRNHPGFACDDQPARIASGLSRLTGQSWTHIYRPAWTTENRACLETGRGNDVETEGLAFFTPGRFVAAETVRLSQGRIGVAVRLASMPDVSIVVTHLSAGRQDHDHRVREIAALLPWAATQGRGLLIGDFNATPEAAELAPVSGRYQDAWLEASRRGRALGIESGATRPGRRLARIDYVFFDPDSRLDIDSVEVVDTAGGGRPEVSDHRPVVATFRRAPRQTSSAATASGTR